MHASAEDLVCLFFGNEFICKNKRLLCVCVCVVDIGKVFSEASIFFVLLSAQKKGRYDTNNKANECVSYACENKDAKNKNIFWGQAHYRQQAHPAQPSPAHGVL